MAKGVDIRCYILWILGLFFCLGMSFQKHFVNRMMFLTNYSAHVKMLWIYLWIQSVFHVLLLYAFCCLLGVSPLYIPSVRPAVRQVMVYEPHTSFVRHVVRKLVVMSLSFHLSGILWEIRWYMNLLFHLRGMLWEKPWYVGLTFHLWGMLWDKWWYVSLTFYLWGMLWITDGIWALHSICEACCEKADGMWNSHFICEACCKKADGIWTSHSIFEETDGVSASRSILRHVMRKKIVYEPHQA